MKTILFSGILIFLTLTACGTQESQSDLLKTRAPKKADHQKNLKALQVDYNYATAAENIAEENRTTIHLRIREELVLKAKAPMAELQIIDLHDHENIKTIQTPIKIMDSETGKINVENLLSNRVYRIWINIVDSGIGQS